MAGIQSVGHSALGHHHRSCPPMDYGCSFFWDSRWGKEVAQERGGSQNAGRGMLYTYTETFNYPIFDAGKGRFVEVAASSDTWPLDGYFHDDRTCIFNTTDPPLGIRGPFTAQAGLTLDTVARPSNHIVLHYGGEALNMARAQNFTGGDRIMYRQETSSATFNRCFALLVKRYDGGIVDESTCTINMTALADPLGATIGVGTTYYKKVREDGWYLVYGFLAPQLGAPDVYYHVSWKNGVHVYYEAPTLQSISTSGEAQVPVLLMNDSVVSTHISEFIFSWNNSLGMALPACGWIAMAFVPRYDGAGPKARTLETGYMVRLADAAAPTARYHQLYTSNSTQSLVYQCYDAAASQCFCEIPNTEYLQGVPIGMVGSWGYRNGGSQYVMAANGTLREVDTSGTMPASAAGESVVYIGSNNAAGVPAAGNLWKIAIGNKMLTRIEACHLSRWFQREAQGLNYVGATGT